MYFIMNFLETRNTQEAAWERTVWLSACSWARYDMADRQVRRGQGREGDDLVLPNLTTMPLPATTENDQVRMP